MKILSFLIQLDKSIWHPSDSGIRPAPTLSTFHARLFLLKARPWLFLPCFCFICGCKSWEYVRCVDFGFYLVIPGLRWKHYPSLQEFCSFLLWDKYIWHLPTTRVLGLLGLFKFCSGGGYCTAIEWVVFQILTTVVAIKTDQIRHRL